MTFGGIRIIEDDRLLDYRKDWSRVRSPSRATRRRRQGHRQNIVITATPKMEAYSLDGGRTLICHPAFADRLRQRDSRGRR